MTTPFSGGCACGAIRYESTAEPVFMLNCHCRDCQRLTGSAFAVNAVYPAAQVETLGEGWGERDVVTDAEGSRSWRCAECGTLLFSDHRMFREHRFVRVGTLDEGERLEPSAHYFVRSKHPWVTIPAGVPAWNTLPHLERGGA